MLAAAGPDLSRRVQKRWGKGAEASWNSVGLRAGQVLQLFLGKACLVGLLGALLGCVLGLVAAMAFGDASNLAEAIDPSVLAVVFLVAPLIAVMGSWIPAVMAARRDPASILQEE